MTEPGGALPDPDPAPDRSRPVLFQVRPRKISILAGIAAFVVVALSVANRRPVTLSLDPFRPDQPAWSVSVPLFALVLGWAVWGDVPNALAWAGIALLMAAGLYLIRRERAR